MNMNKSDRNGNQKNKIKVIISPAKKMKETDVLPPESTPVFLTRTEHLYEENVSAAAAGGLEM